MGVGAAARLMRFFLRGLGRRFVNGRAEGPFLGSWRSDDHVLVGDVAFAGVLKLNQTVSRLLTKQFHTSLFA